MTGTTPTIPQPVPGKALYTGMALQSALGTPAPSINMWTPVTAQPSLQTKPNNTSPQEFRKFMDERFTVYRTGLNTSGGWQQAAYSSGGLLHALYGIFGNYTVAAHTGGTDIYDYTFNTDYSLPFFTVSMGYENLAMLTYQDYIFKSLQVDFKDNAAVNLTIDGIGRFEGLDRVAATPTYTSTRPLTNLGISVSLNSTQTAKVTDMSLKIDRATVKKDVFVQGFEHYAAAPTTMNVTGTATLLFADWSDYQMFMGAEGTTVFTQDDLPTTMFQQLDINVDGQVFKTGTPDICDNVHFTVPSIYWDTASPKPAFNDQMTLDVTFNAVFNPSSSNSISASAVSQLTDITVPTV